MFKGTTVLGIIKDGKAVIGADGQITHGDTILKHTAVKVRKLYKDRILAGFAGSVADALTLFERMEEMLERYGGDLKRASIELARLWRQDKVLRRLEALLAVLDRETALIISGSGDIIEPENKIVAIGSGAPYAQAAAYALLEYTDLDAREICEVAIKIASRICIYTNANITILEL